MSRENLVKFMILTSLSQIGGDNYFDMVGIDYYDDKELNDCLFYMYLAMLSGPDDPKYEVYYKRFDDLFSNLSESKQEIVMKEFSNILEKQQEQKEKVKKKGNE